MHTRPTTSRRYSKIAGAAMLCFLGWSSFALGATELKLGSGSGLPGAIVFVPVVLEGSSAVVAAQFDVDYESALLRTEGLFGAEGVPEMVLTSREIKPGTRRVLLYAKGSKPFASPVTLNLSLRIAANATAGRATLSFTNAILSDAQGRRVTPVAFSPGQVEIRTGLGPQFTSIAVDPNGVVQLQLQGRPGTPYLMQMSSDFRTWTQFGSDIAFSIDGRMTVTDTNRVKPPYRFYRAVASP